MDYNIPNPFVLWELSRCQRCLAVIYSPLPFESTGALGQQCKSKGGEERTL